MNQPGLPPLLLFLADLALAQAVREAAANQTTPTHRVGDPAIGSFLPGEPIAEPASLAAPVRASGAAKRRRAA
jgi:hypothetical protein